MTDRSVPAGYEWPGMDTGDATVFYLSEQEDWTGATPLFMVHKQWPGGQTVVAEKCYRAYGVEIVDALRGCVVSADELAERERVVRNRARLEQVARSGLDAMPTELTLLLGEYDRRGADLARVVEINADLLRMTADDRKARSKLTEQRDVVLALHRDVEGQGFDGNGNYVDFEHACSTCGTCDEYAVAWPCSTVEALGGAS